MAQPRPRPIVRPSGPPKPRVPVLLMKVWDAPTRLFHWAVVLLVAFSYLAVEMDWMKWHYLSGYTLLALLLFRVAWGFVGSETSRFQQFLRSPAEGLRHLASFRGQREPDTEIGHNAAGGWMVLALLAVLLVQVGTGLFARSDGGGGGPLNGHLSRKAGEWVAGLHAFSFNVVLGLTAVHILAIIAYAVVKRHDLVRAMVTGKKRLPANLRQPRFASPALAAAILAGTSVLVWLVVRFA